MRIKRTLLFSLILFLMIFSISFVSANENVVGDVDANELSTLSVSADIQTDESINEVVLDSDDNQGLEDVSSNSNEESSTSNLDLKDGTSNNDEIEDDVSLSNESDEDSSIESDECLTNNGKVPTLRANPLGADHDLTGGQAQEVMDMIQQISREGGGTLYLNGGTYQGSAHARIWTGNGYRDVGRNEIINISNVRVVGGSRTNPNQVATFQVGSTSTSLAFSGYGTWDGNGNRYYADSGINLTNVTFESLNCTGRFFSFNSGNLTDCVFNNLESYQHLFFVTGSYIDEVPMRLTNCNFTNSKQTYLGNRPEGGTDGSGQFGVVFGAEMYGCNFINTSTATHGGAFCLSDEWISAACVPSKLIDCNFINITSRWFAVYIHGNYSDTTRFLNESQVLENCNFINCTGTGEYGGALGISHNSVLIRNCNFTDNTGGEGSAIMVGGIKYLHDGFLGNNTEGNNITIDNCIFKNNVAKTEGQSSSISPNLTEPTTPTGYAGAVFVYGNHTNIIDSVFINNTAVDSCGAAIYIEGQNTTVTGCEFYDHNSANGTIYLVGNDCEISDSYFHDNNASSTGSCIFIIGNSAEIGNTTFVNNTAPDGGCIFIKGDHTLIDNDTKFISNNATNGAGVYINGSDTQILNSSFINNTAVNGAGALINGHDTYVNGSGFEGNNATNGGAVYIEGNINILSNNTFLKNNVTNQGGAVYINGNNSNVTYNNFTGNEAVPLSEDEETGLGGAIFVNGHNTTTVANSFFHNKARNGSAIYTDGTNFRLHNDVFFENQAWSYLLVTTAVPPESLYNSEDVEINVVHRAGDNIINAIHNRNSPNEIHLRNVTYVNSRYGNITTTDSGYVEPVDGVENSEGGTLLYQDDREDYQTIQLKVEHENGQVYYPMTTMQTNIYGNVNITLPKSSLRKGKYIVEAEHIEDWNYKFIYNTTTFRILDSMDVSVNKTSDKDEYFQDEIAEWEIIVNNVANGTDAEDVTITDHLPNIFELTDLNYTFISPLGEFTNGTLDLNTKTLRYGVYNSSTGSWVYADAHYDEGTNTWSYYFLDLDDDTITYTVFNQNDFISNFGPIVYSNSTDFCYENISYNVPTENWYYDVITVNGQEIRYGHFNETRFEQYFGPSHYDAENLTWVFTHIGPDPLNPGADTELYTLYNVTTGYWVIDNEIFAPERKTVTQKVSLTISNDTANNITNIALFIKDFDKNSTGALYFATNCTKSGDYTNVVNVTTPDFDWDLSNNVANRSVLVDPLPNKTVSNSTPYYHDYVEYNLTIMNTGNSTYDQTLTVVDSLPEGLEYNATVIIIGADQVGETLVENQGRLVTWNITNIPANTNATIIVRVYVNALGNLTNNMTLIAPSGDNRTVNATITPVTFTDVYVNKSVEKEEYFVGDIVIWTITVTNAYNGSNATNVNLSDILPAEVEFINASIGEYNNETGVLEIGFMENGTSVTFTITSRAKVVANNVTNNATVNCSEDEWDYTNNIDNATIDIIPIPNKTANNTAPKFSEYVDYNLTIINVGGEAYTDILTVIDSLPVGLVYNNTVAVIGADQVGDEVVDGQVITWRVTNIPANTNATIIVRVQAIALGTLVNNYTLIGPKGSNRTVNATITVDPNVDLSVNKTSDKVNYFVNDTVIWTITVSNARNATSATNVTLRDILPSEVEFVSSNGTYDNETGEWYIGFMENGTSTTIVIYTRAIESKTNVTNVANVSCNEIEWDYTNNVDNATINIYPLINKTVSDPTPDYHEIIEYYLIVENTGDVIFNDSVILVDSLPEGVTFLGMVSYTGLEIISFDNTTKNLTWNVTNIAANTNATITIRARCDAVGTQINNWTIYAPDGLNRTVNATIDVQPVVDISVEKTSDRVNYFVNDTVIWTITVSNANNGTNATNVTLRDILPSEVEFVSSNGTYDNETGEWYIGFMENGTSTTIVIYTRAIESKTNVTNVANVTCNETEWDYDNNVDNATINIYPLINKTVSNPTPEYYEIIEYYLIVENTGDVIFNDSVILVDSLPADVTFLGMVSYTGLEIISFDNTTKNLTWNVTNIAANTNATITIRARCDAVGTQVNNWTIYAPDGLNRTVNATINVDPIVDVSVEKTSDRVNYFVNDTVIWTITVSNANNGTNATNVTLRDILPSEVEFISSNGTYDNETGEWYIGFMENGTSTTIVIYTRAIESKTNITNVANVTCNEIEWNYDNNVDNATINIYPLINKTVSNPTPDYHEIVEYYLVVENTGDIMFNGSVILVDSLPEGVTFLGMVGYDGLEIISFDNTTKNLTWNVTNIAANTNATITIRARCDAVGTQVNNWTIYAPDGLNRTVNATIEVQPIVDVSVEKTSDKVNYFVNDTVIWTITVSNANNGTNATNVTLRDILPSEVEFVSSNGTYDNETGEWYIGFMENGTSTTIVIYTRAIESKTNVTNVANVSCNETEWNYTNNVDNATINIYPLINKTVSDPTPDYHEIIEYYLIVENTGDVIFNDSVILVDSLPEGVTFLGMVSYTGLEIISFDNTTKNLTWNVTNIAANTNATITIRARCDAVGTQVNNWTIYGPDGMNRTVNATINVTPVVDVSVEKTSDKVNYFVNDTVIWIITVSNANNGTNATNVTLRDILPSEVEFVSSNGTYDNETGVWYIGFMENGTSTTIVIYTRAIESKTNVTNVANVTCNETEWNYTNNVDNATINIYPLINKTVSNPVPDYHEIVEYYLIVENTGDVIFNDSVILVDSLPADVTFLGMVSYTGLEIISFDNTTKNLTWNVTNIAANTNATITIRARCDAVGTQVNNWTIYAPDGMNRTVNATINVDAIVDVSVEKTADSEYYFVNDTVIWTITVSNANNGTNATNVTLRDILPKEVEFVSSNGTYDNATGEWYIGFMENGTSTTIVITTRAIESKPNVTNVANVTCTEEEWNYTNNVDNATIHIYPLINKTVNNPKPYYHELVNFTITVENTGNATFNDSVILVDNLPEGVSFVRMVSYDGLVIVSFDNTTSRLVWNVTNVTAKTNATIVIETRCELVDLIGQPVTINRPDGVNRTVYAEIDVQPIVDVSVEKTADSEYYFVNDTVIWTITVSNANNGTNATNVTLRDILPKEVEFVSSNGTYDNATGEWYIGFMENGTSTTIVITTRAIESKPNVTNVANVTCTEEEWNYTNNVDNATIHIYPLINKTVNNPKPYYHELVNFTITVENTGNATFNDSVILVDNLPEGVSFVRMVSYDGLVIVSFDNTTSRLVWNVTNVTAKTNATIVIETRCELVDLIGQPVTINRPDGVNRTVYAEIDVQPIVDVSVEKTADSEYYFVNDTVIWTITVSNANNGTNATNVTLRDILPKEVEFVSSNGTYDNATGEWYIGFMENGTSTTIVITTRAIESKPNVTNVANVTCTEEEWNYTNNVDNATIHIYPLINKTVNNPKPYYHELVNFTITVENTGNATFNDSVILVDNLPEGVSFVRMVSYDGLVIVSFDNTTSRLVWNVTNVTAKTNATIVIETRCDWIGLIGNPGTINRPDGVNRTVYAEIDVQPIVDVSVVKIADKEEYKVNETVVWTITVSNANNGTNATDVLLKDILPKEVEFVSYTATQGTYDNVTGVWDIGNMTNGTSVRLTIISTAKIPKYNITNNATVNCTEDEWDYTNNFDDATINIIPTINKTVNNTEPYYHEIVEYNLTIINYGDTVYTDNLTVIDVLDPGLEFIGTVSITGANVVVGETRNGQTISWVLTNISTSNAVITVKVKANAIGVENNTMIIRTPKGTNMSVNRSITVKPIVDVSVKKTSDKVEYFKDGIAIWTITVSNAANGTNATNVVLEDLLPSEFGFINYTATKGTYNNNTGIWTIGTMFNGTSEKLVIRSYAKVAPRTVTNVANVSCEEDEWNYTNNIANRTVKIYDIPDLNKTVNNATPFYNDTVVYTLTIKNVGNATYTDNLRVIDSLPNGLTYVETVSFTGAKLIKQVVNGQTITWTITNIAAKSSAVIKVKVKVKALGELTNNLTIVGPRGTNKTVNCTIDPVPWADLAVFKTSDHFGVDCHNDTTVIWTIKVVNYGPNTAVNSIAKDILPAGLVYIDDDSNGKYDPGTGVWTIGNLAKGKSVVIHIKTKVDAIDTRINNPVVVSSKTYDPNKTNNRDNSSIKVISVADLEIIKDANVTKLTVGENFSYLLTVINHGPDTAINARVYDILPKGLKLLSFEASKGSYNPKNGTWTIGDMVNGERVTLKINVMALVEGKIINEARVESDTYDNDTSNNNDSATVEVIGDNPPHIPMRHTGNPLVIALLSLFAIVGMTLKRKN